MREMLRPSDVAAVQVDECHLGNPKKICMLSISSNDASATGQLADDIRKLMASHGLEPRSIN